jgi:enoyl-CoA hydratase/carnithine racemase
MSEELVLGEQQDGLVYLTLNQPEKRNALSRAMLTALKRHLQEVAGQPQARVVILRAKGPVFSAGHDLKELTSSTGAEIQELFRLCTSVMELLPALPQPVIAQVHALATAAGCQLVTSCDLVMASSQASFAVPGVKIGLFCATPSVPLSRTLPTKKALEMLLTGAPMSAAEAERFGMVNRVVPPERLEEETHQLARQIMAYSAPVLASGKAAFYRQLPLDRSAAYRLVEPVIVQQAQAADLKEGVAAFFAKRPPQWPSAQT